MMVATLVSIHDLQRTTRGYLKSDLFIAVVEGTDSLGGYELENYGVSCVLPAEQHPEDAEQNAVASKNISPNRTPCPVGNHEGNIVSSSCRGSAFEDNRY